MATSHEPVIIFDTEAEMPSSVRVREGTLAYAIDTDKTYKYSGSAWVDATNTAANITIADAGNDFTATTVEGALDELQSDNEAHVAAADPHTGYVLESLIDAAGDLIVGSAADTVARLAKGSPLDVLRVNSGGTALEWAAPAATGFTTNFLAAPVTLGSSATDLGLGFTTTTNKTYAIRAQFVFNSTNAEALTLSTTGPVGLVPVYIVTSTGNPASSVEHSQTLANAPSLDQPLNNLTNCWIVGYLSGTYTGGAFTFLAARGTAGTCLKGSYLEYKQVD